MGKAGINKQMSLIQQSEEDQEVAEAKRLQEVEERKKVTRQSDKPVSLDDETLYELPSKVPVTMNRLFYRSREGKDKSQKKNKESEDSPEKAKLKSLKRETSELKTTIDSVFEKHIFVWKETNNWQYAIPPTIFSGSEAPVTFFQPKIEYGTHELSKLTKDQLSTIKKEGTFLIRASDASEEDEGTTWQMNPFLVKGEAGILKTFNKNLSFAWHQLLQIRCRIIPRFSENYYVRLQVINPNVVSGVRGLTSLVFQFLNLTFGLRKVHVYSKDQVLKEIIKERNLQTVNANWKDIKSAFFAYVDQMIESIPSSEVVKQKAKEILCTDFERLGSDFGHAVSKYESSKLRELEKSGVEEDAALLQVFNEKQRMLFEMIRSNKYIKIAEAQEHLIALIQATQIYRRHYTDLQKAIETERQVANKELEVAFPVKSLVHIWKQDQLQTILPPRLHRISMDYNQKITSDLAAAGLKSELLLFKRFADFQDSHETIYRDNYARIQKASTTPCRTFETVQQLFPPYKIEKTKGYYSDNRSYFREIKTKSYFTKTDFFGWRVVLQFIRWKVWTINVFITLIHNLWQGSLGLQFFIRTEKFPGKREVGQYHDPFWVKLCNIKLGIEKSRARFESTPDRGIFGKNFARYYNYVECYLFRAIIAGFLVVCIILPILAVLNCAFSLLLALTSFLWIPVTLTLRFLHHLFFWDFDSPTRKGWYSYPTSYLMYQTVESFPVVRIVFQIIFSVLEIALSLLSAVVIHPSIALFSIGQAHVRRVISNTTDAIMWSITGRVGRQPEMDTFIAWKVKGKGVARQYSYAIDTDDVKFLLRGKLEEMELEEYGVRMNKRIDEPSEIYNALSTGLFKNFGNHTPSSDYISQNISELKKQLNKQLQERKKVLPQAPRCNIKFSEEELQVIFNSCEQIVEQFIKARNMQWVFTKYYSDITDDYKQLTEQLIVKVFNDENVLFPLSEQDKRVEVKKSKEAKYHSIKRAIEGEGELIKLSHSIVQRRFKKFRKTELFPFVSASDVRYNVQEVNNGYITYDLHSAYNNCCFAIANSDYVKAANKQNEGDKKSN